MKKIITIILALLLVTGLMVACANNEPEADPTPPAEVATPDPVDDPEDDEEDVEPENGGAEVLDSLEGMTLGAFVVIEDQFQRALQMAMAETFEYFGAHVITANAASLLDTEVTNIHNALAAGLDGLAIFPVDPTGSIAALREAADQGVMIYSINVNLEDTGPGLQVGWGQSDQYGKGVEVGEYAREWMLANFDESEFPLRMAVMQFHGLNTAMSDARTGGFMSQVYDLVEIIVEVDDWMADSAVNTAADVLVAHPDIQVWWWANEGAAVGSVMAQRAAGVTIPGWTIAMSPQIAELILSDDGNLIAANGQNPQLLGHQVAYNLSMAIMGRPFETFIETGGIMLKASDPAGAQAWLDEQGN